MAFEQRYEDFDHVKLVDDEAIPNHAVIIETFIGGAQDAVCLPVCLPTIRIVNDYYHLLHGLGFIGIWQT